MGRTIEIPESLYRDLSLPSLLEGLVGAIDGSKNPHPPGQEAAFGEYVANKLEKQGIRQH